MGEGDVNFMGSKRNSKYQASWPSQQWALWQTPEPKGWKEMISRKREATRHHLCWMVHGLINTREWGGVRKQSQIEHAIRKGYGTEAKGDPWVWDGWRGWASAPEPPIVCGGVIKVELISPLFHNSCPHPSLHHKNTKFLLPQFIYVISSYKHHPYPRLTAHDLYFENWMSKSFLFQPNPSIPHAPWSCYNMLYLLCTIVWLLINSWQRNK